MFRSLPYIVLFVIAVLAQVLIFDSLTISVMLSPLIYIVFLMLLPIETKPIVVLGLGVALGITMDLLMGTEGLNSIATIFIAFFRASLLQMLFGKERGTQRGVPSEAVLGASDFIRYIVVMVLIHHLIYFAFETLSLATPLYTLMRFGVSSVVTMLFVWLIARLFTTSNFLK